MAIVKKEHIVERWGILIEGAQGRGEEVLKRVEEGIENSGVDNVKTKKSKISASVGGLLLGKQRDFLILEETKNLKLKPYRLFLNARDYGNNLDVSWYLIAKFPFLYYLIRPWKYFKRVVIGDLNFFDEQDLRAYVTLCHHEVLRVVEDLLTSLNQDPSKINRQTRGFLGIS